MIRIPAGTHILNRQVRLATGAESLEHGCLAGGSASRAASQGLLHSHQATYLLPSLSSPQIIIKRPRLVLRGDGSATTILKVDSPLKDIPNVPKPKGGYGFYNQGQCCWGIRVLAGWVAVNQCGLESKEAAERGRHP